MSFYRTDDFLRTDDFRRWFFRAVVLAVVLGLWITWFVAADVTVFEESDAARLESAEFVHTIEASVPGRVAEVVATLGSEVRAGDVLFELEAEDQHFELLEAESRLAARRAALELALGEIDIEQQRLAAERRSAGEEAEEARTRAEVDEVNARFAQSELEQLKPLQEAGLISLRERLQLEAEAERTRTEAEAEQLGLDSLAAEQQAAEQEILARLTRLRREAAAMTGDVEDLEAHLRHLQHDLEERSVRAPIDGRLGWVSDRQVGTFVGVGQRLAEIVPAGTLRAVAYFPASALGRLRRGQKGRMRLEAFPWTQYGMLDAEVERVATEPEAGRIRTELIVRPDPSSAISLEHGLIGRVEVEVEAISPALLVLRAAGDTFRSRDVG